MTLEISNHELAALTVDLDALHRDTLPAVLATVAGLADRMRDASAGDTSRRRFLAGGTALVGAALLAACGSGTTSPTAVATPTATGSDVQIATLAASIELLAVNTYTAALKAASQNAFGPVPPAVSQFAATAKGQHADHLRAWNAVITAAGKPAVTTPDAALDTMVAGQITALKTITDVAKLALSLETIATASYVSAAPLIADPGYRALAMTVAPVEAQHVAILNFVLGVYPVPDSQIKLDQARGVSDLSA